MSTRRYRGSLAVWVLLIAYASLYPFWPLRLPGPDALAEMFLRPRYITAFDVGLNFVAYIPLGMLGSLYYAEGENRMPGALRAVLFGTVLSFTMEVCQLFIPYRVSSIFDVMANAGGALAGALLFSDPFYSVVVRPLGAWRESALVPGMWGDTGVMLLVLWLIAQLNPALPFFGAGDIAETGLQGTGADVLQVAAVALGICGFGLFVSALLRGAAGSLRITLILLSVALWLKFVSATFMLQPHFSADWVSVGRIAGLAAGLVALYPLRRLPRSGRIYAAIVTMLAGALLAKIFGAYSGLDTLLRLFRWPYGQLAGFTTLTRFLHELWPLAALTFLIALFLRLRRGPMP